MKKRLLSILLVCCMVFSLLPVTVLAADDNIPFEDVKTTDWFYDEVCYAYEKGLMQGTSATTFDPTGTTSRAMIVTILYRLEGEPALRNANVFTDVVSGNWYEKAVVWANGNGIVTGYGDGKFGPNDPITREQLTAIMYRYADYKEYDVSVKADLAKFTDSSKISSYAVDALAWANAAGLITGTGVETLDPQGSAVRAQAAAILTRFCKEVVPVKTEKKPVSGGGGSYTPPTNENLTISEAKAVTGGTYNNVTITSAVGNGDVTLDGVKINGKLIVQGGGSESIHINNCEVDTIQVDKDTTVQGAQTPRIELSNTPVEHIEAIQPVIIEADTASTVKAVEAKSDVTVQGAATKVDSVSVPESASTQGVTLEIKGAKIATVAAEQPLTIEATDGAAPIEKVEVKDNLTVQGNAAQIEKVEVPATAVKQPVIDVQTGSVGTVEANKPAEVKGSGTVTNVEANAEVKVASETVVTVTVTASVTVTVTGNQPVEVAVETTEAVNISAADAQVEVTTTQEISVNVQVNEQPVAHVHKWTKESEIPATCSAEGSVTYTCSGEGGCDMGGTKTEKVALLPHTVEVDEAVPATCETAGKTAGSHCSVCQTVIVEQQTIPELGHEYGEANYSWVKDGDNYKCTATRVCAHDASHKETETATASYAVTTPATCEATGVGTYTASFTNAAFAQQTKTGDIAALGHDYTVAQHDNSQHWMKCSRCESTTTKTDHSYDAHNCEETATCKDCEYVKPAGQHSYGAYSMVTPATCTENGSEHAFCAICQHEDVREITKLGHDWENEFTEDVPATCETVGSKSYHCTRCEATSDVTEIPMLGHDYGEATYAWAKDGDVYKCTATRVCAHDASHKETETVTASYAVTTPATCETKGVGTYTATFVNNEFAAQTKAEDIAALGHDYTVAQHDESQHWMKCSRCDSTTAKTNHSYDAHSCDVSAKCKDCEYVKPAGLHSYGAYSVVTPATCTEKGSEKAVCNICQHEDVREITELGHNWENEFTEDIPATCETVGSKSHHCTRCEVTKDVTEIPMLGHDYGEATYAWAKDGDVYKCTATRVCTHDASHKETETATASYAVTTPAACETKGVGTYTASFQNAAFSTQTKTEDIAALGHDYTVAQHNESQHWMKCSRCDSTTTKTNHSYDAHDCTETTTCKGCEYVKPAGQHSYGAYSVITPATCTEDGSEHAFCSICEHEDIREITKLGHDWRTEFTEDVPATCETVGSKSYHCTRCEAKTDVTEIPMLGHDYGEAAYTWAKDGDDYKCTATRVCAHDASHKETETATASYAVTTPATCETKGVGTHTATFQNSAFTQQTKTEDVAALGHSFGVPTYEWTQTETGYTCTAERVCARDDTHKEGETVTASYAVTSAPKCEEKGEGTYTATFVNAAFAQQTKTVEIAALEHNYVNGECTKCHEKQAFTVKFLKDDDTVISTQSVKYGEDAVLPENPTKDSYDFICWDTNTTNVTCDLEVKALFAPAGQPVFVVSNAKAVAGAENVEITVALRNNPGITSLGLNVAFDDALTLTSIAYNTEISGQSIQPQKKVSPVKLTWMDALAEANVTGDWVFATLKFSLAETASVGKHQILLTYDEDNVYDMSETNVHFHVINGAIYVAR